MCILFNICDALRNLEECYFYPWRSATFSKVAGFSQKVPNRANRLIDFHESLIAAHHYVHEY